MQYYSRLKIMVDSIENWKKLNEIDFEEFDLSISGDYILSLGKKEFDIDGEWSCTEIELQEIVSSISEVLKGKCMIIADATCISVDEYTYWTYYFGDNVKNGYYLSERNKKLAGLFSETEINKVDEWLNFGKFRLKETEKEYLAKYNIEYDKETKKYVDLTPEEPKVVYYNLVGTQYEGRNERIENLKIGDELQLVREPDNPYDSNAILVINDKGSIGHLLRCDAEYLAPCIDSGKISIKKVVVADVIPLSKQKNGRKSAHVYIGITMQNQNK